MLLPLNSKLITIMSILYERARACAYNHVTVLKNCIF